MVLSAKYVFLTRFRLNFLFIDDLKPARFLCINLVLLIHFTIYTQFIGFLSVVAAFAEARATYLMLVLVLYANQRRTQDFDNLDMRIAIKIKFVDGRRGD